MATDQRTEPRWRRAGPPYHLTRAELLDELRRRGYTITAQTLQKWARAGLIPRPARRRPPGATDGVARAMYAAALLPVLERLLRESGPGLPLAGDEGTVDDGRR